jgi:glycopeptidolipid biosynthesis protein
VSINPFDDHEQHRLWRPRRCSSQQAGRVACLDYIEQNWTDVRPKGLRQRPAEDGGLIG